MKYLYEMMDTLNSDTNTDEAFRNYLKRHRPEQIDIMVDAVGETGTSLVCLGAQMIVEIIQEHGVPEDLNEIGR